MQIYFCINVCQRSCVYSGTCLSMCAATWIRWSLSHCCQHGGGPKIAANINNTLDSHFVPATFLIRRNILVHGWWPLKIGSTVLTYKSELVMIASRKGVISKLPSSFSEHNVVMSLVRGRRGFYRNWHGTHKSRFLLKLTLRTSRYNVHKRSSFRSCRCYSYDFFKSCIPVHVT